jgi:hypothetical protein
MKLLVFLCMIIANKQHITKCLLVTIIYYFKQHLFNENSNSLDLRELAGLSLDNCSAIAVCMLEVVELAVRELTVAVDSMD